MTLTVSDLHHLAAVAIAEPECQRDGCSCDGALAELHALVAARCAQDAADAERRRQECALLGHDWPSWVPDRWMQRRVTCKHCGAKQ